VCCVGETGIGPGNKSEPACLCWSGSLFTPDRVMSSRERSLDWRIGLCAYPSAAIRPPGRVTRAISVTAREGSSRCWSTVSTRHTFERIVLERKGNCIAHQEAHIESAPSSASSRLRDHGLADVDLDRASPGMRTPCQRDDICAAAASDVKPRGSALGSEPLEHLLLAARDRSGPPGFGQTSSTSGASPVAGEERTRRARLSWSFATNSAPRP
jgi:hypothetical protein